MKKGRPRLDAADESVPVHVTMTARDYDTTCERARLARVSVPEIIRRDVLAATRSWCLCTPPIGPTRTD